MTRLFQRTQPTRFALLLVFAALLTSGLLTGCTESFTGYDETDTVLTTAEGSKFRHAPLLDPIPFK